MPPTRSAKRISPKRLDTLDKSGTVFAEFTALAIQHDAVNLGQGFPTLPVPDFIKKAASTAVESNGLLNQYTRSEGHPRLVKALAELYTPKIGREINPLTEIITTVGATEAYSHATFYDSYPASVTLAGGIPVIVNLSPPRDRPSATSDDWKLDINELRSAITSKTKLLFVNNPHNPVGKVWSRTELEAIAKIADEFDLLVIADEVYESLVYSDSPSPMIKFASLPGMFERTITLGSIGKMFGVTGWKIGWCIGSEEIIRSIWMIHQFVPFAVVTPLQEATASALEQAMKSDYFETTAKQYEDLRDQLRNLLSANNLSPTVPHGGYFIMADTSALEDKVNESTDPAHEHRRDYRVCRFLTTEVGVTAIPRQRFTRERREQEAMFLEDTRDAATQRFKKYFSV
ncbi:pyridoxal phosphate-dependent transferase [Chytridium lagenaria]|nr:pyridoxal phosphate-dependent transferase [Chytridium lagenaria]